MSQDLIYIQHKPGEIVMFSAAEEINYGQWYEARNSLNLPVGTGDSPDTWKYELVETDDGDVHVWTLEVEQ